MTNFQIKESLRNLELSPVASKSIIAVSYEIVTESSPMPFHFKRQPDLSTLNDGDNKLHRLSKMNLDFPSTRVAPDLTINPMAKPARPVPKVLTKDAVQRRVNLRRHLDQKSKF